MPFRTFNPVSPASYLLKFPEKMIVLNLLTENSRWVPLLHLKRSEGPLNVLNRGLSRTYICFFKISISIAL